MHQWPSFLRVGCAPCNKDPICVGWWWCHALRIFSLEGLVLMPCSKNFLSKGWCWRHAPRTLSLWICVDIMHYGFFCWRIGTDTIHQWPYDDPIYGLVLTPFTNGLVLTPCTKDSRLFTFVSAAIPSGLCNKPSAQNGHTWNQTKII